jgi:flavin reductase (DIM6/NTAB) family NADH-FMN oxidoreductase RutF
MMEQTPYDAIMPGIIKQLKTGAFLSVQTGDDVSVMTIAWASFGCIWGKSIMTIVVRPTRYTFDIIERAKDFSVSIPSNDMARELELCGTVSGNACDKLKRCNLETMPAKKVDSCVIAVPGIHIECKIVYKSAINPEMMLEEYKQIYPKKDYHTMYYGEILECYST